MWVKPLLGLGLATLAGRASAHALGTDPTLIERLEAGATLPFELGLSWTLWFIFAIWAGQHLDRAGYLFSGLGFGAALGAGVGSGFMLPAWLLWGLLLGLSVWMTTGLRTSHWMLSVCMATAGCGVMTTLLAVHADLAEDGLIRVMAGLFLIAGASFIGGVLKPVVERFPSQASIGLRILAGWMVAGVSIQWAVSQIS